MYPLSDTFTTVDPWAPQQFVGLHISDDRPKMTFPLGYATERPEQELRNDARLLITLLRHFDHAHEEVWVAPNPIQGESTTRLAVSAYITLIEDFLRTGRVLSERISKHSNNPDGRIDWQKTIATQRPVISNGALVYLDLVARQDTSSYHSLVTIAHEYAIHYAFQKLGWLYPKVQVPSPTISHSTPDVIAAVRERLNHTFNDHETSLLRAILSILLEEDDRGMRGRSTYGVYKFEVPWELMVKTAFSNQSIRLTDYYPRTSWALRNNHFAPRPLKPDSVMVDQNDLFILDAKYYRYGVTHDHNDLPGSQDIGKQIIYGEYAYQKYGRKYSNIYNAFIIPSNLAANGTAWCHPIGTATGDWIGARPLSFQKILGVLVDTSFLLRNYVSSGPRLRAELATCIRQSFIDSKKQLSRVT